MSYVYYNKSRCACLTDQGRTGCSQTNISTRFCQWESIITQQRSLKHLVLRVYKSVTLTNRWSNIVSQNMYTNHAWILTNFYCNSYSRQLHLLNLFFLLSFSISCNKHTKAISLQWRHNERDSVSNHQPRDCFPNRLFRRRSKKASKLRVTGFCAGNSPGTGEFP